MKRLCAALVVITSAVAGAQQSAGPMVGWPYVGADQAHTKYSTLADINRCERQRPPDRVAMGSS